jgi:dihydrofolate synthase/folylpolyglutamate synthase
MTYPEAIQFLYDLRWFGLKLGLENTFKLAALAGNPQDRLRFIHVAGTNGKGSTCAMLESVYRAAGLRVGLFTSPHLVSFRERIQINRQLISENDVVRLVADLREQSRAGLPPAPETWRACPPHGGDAAVEPPGTPTASGLPDPCDVEARVASDRRDACPTFFEFVTVMALKYFAEQNCDLVIWETGMGGRLDATNIVMPLASVITNIQFDHQKWLGNTLEEIAAEKAGIIKPGMPVITATDTPEALEVITKVAREKNAALINAGQASRLSGAGETPALPLLGAHQRLNAVLAVATVGVLQNRIPVSDEAIRRGLETVQWPGRLQLVTTLSGQIFLLDGAHNAAGADALREALHSRAIARAIPVRPSSAKDPRDPCRQDSGSTLILGILEDKDWQQVCATLAPLAGRILLVPVPSERTASPELMRDACARVNPSAKTITCPSLADALKQTVNDPFVIITGSLYLVGEAMEWLGLSPATAEGERGLNEWTLRK